MLKLDNSLLDELGLGSLSEDQKRAMLQHIYETLELRVGTDLANQMTDQQLEDFEKFIGDGGDANQAQALQWLESNLPHYKEVVNRVFEELKTEIKNMAPQILASSAAQPTQVPANGASMYTAQDGAQQQPAGLPPQNQNPSMGQYQQVQPHYAPQHPGYSQPMPGMAASGAQGQPPMPGMYGGGQQPPMGNPVGQPPMPMQSQPFQPPMPGQPAQPPMSDPRFQQSGPGQAYTPTPQPYPQPQPPAGPGTQQQQQYPPYDNSGQAAA